MGFVYIFQNGNGNYFKIGRTKSNIEKRRKELSTGNPKPLRVFDVIETEHDILVESYLHKKFYNNLCNESDATEYYLIEPEELHKGLEEAKKFLAEYISALEEADKYKERDPNGTVKQPDEELIEVYKKLCHVKGEIAGLEFEQQILENKIKSKIGDADGIDGIASWKIQIRTQIDSQSLKEHYPDIYQQCIKETKFRMFRLL